MSDAVRAENPLGSEKIGNLLLKFAVPSIVAMLVNALYNIVDQIFIGQGVGYLGNAATNVAFPLTTISLAISLLLAQGCAAKQNLELGAGRREVAERAVGNMIIMAVFFGLLFFAVTSIFMRPMLSFFGATDEVMPLSAEYVRIILFGLPFSMISTGMNATIRADGSPMFAMLSMLAGAIINTILDPIFIFVFKWGMAGAAYATIAGQIISCFIVVSYVRRYKHITITRACFRVDFSLCRVIIALGVASFTNQISMSVVQIVLNKSMTHYGELSRYGSAIPLACAGIVSKATMIFFAVMIGIAQGSQPIISFNYGAKKYERVKRAYMCAVRAASIAAGVAFVVFQLFPYQIAALFGKDGGTEYFELVIMFFRVNLMMIFLNGVQPVTGTFFTSIGKAFKGTFVSLTRQLLFLLPLIVVLPMFFGIEGILYAAPIADAFAFIVAVLLVRKEFNNMSSLISIRDVVPATQ